MRFLRRLAALLQYDYVPPGLAPLPAGFEALFPHVRRVPSFNRWVPHTGRQDRRFPGVGLCSLDELTLLYNYGLNFQGETALEIGCWVGWSTAALTSAGVRLTVMDPVLAGAAQGDAAREALALAGSISSVELVPARSPSAVLTLNAAGRRWSMCFIDGDHTGDAPLRDAQACAAAAQEDCVILLHDLVQPNICDVLDWLASAGWSCGLHYTAQMLGVAWRGEAKPVSHRPDPRVRWEALLEERFPHCCRFARV